MIPMIKDFHDVTPTIDKGLAVLGVLVAGYNLSEVSEALGIVSTTIGILVGIASLAMIVPRAILNRIELRKTRQAEAKAARLLAEAERESSDY
jgi:putative copper export protein